MRNNHRDTPLWITVLGIFFVGLMLIAFYNPADAGSWGSARCVPYAKAVEGLKHHFGEVPLAEGSMVGGKYKVHLFLSRSGTWTLVVERPDKVGCSIFNGTNWTASSTFRVLPHSSRKRPLHRFKSDGDTWQKLGPGNLSDLYHRGLR